MKDIMKSFWTGLKLIWYSICCLVSAGLTFSAFWVTGKSEGWSSVGCFTLGILFLIITLLSVWGLGEWVRTFKEE